MVKVVKFGKHDVVAFDKCDDPWCADACAALCEDHCNAQCGGEEPLASSHYNSDSCLDRGGQDGPLYWEHRFE